MSFPLRTGLAAGLALASLAFATPAIAAPAHAWGAKPAIRRVQCDGSTPFLRINTNDENWRQLCFANAGTIGVTIYRVTGLYSGNNRGRIFWDDSSSEGVVNFEKGGYYSLSREHTVTAIAIY